MKRRYREGGQLYCSGACTTPIKEREDFPSVIAGDKMKESYEFGLEDIPFLEQVLHRLYGIACKREGNLVILQELDGRYVPFFKGKENETNFFQVEEDRLRVTHAERSHWLLEKEGNKVTITQEEWEAFVAQICLLEKNIPEGSCGVSFRWKKLWIQPWAVISIARKYEEHKRVKENGLD